MSDHDDKQRHGLLWIFIVSILLLAVLNVQGAIDWLDQRSCRERGGRVEHYDANKPDEWQCVDGRAGK